MLKYILTLTFICLCSLARGQGSYECSYWIDSDIGNRKTIALSNRNENLKVDISSLGNGIHSLHLQVEDENGVASSPITRVFFKAHAIDTSGQGLFQFDDEGNMYDVNMHTGAHTVDASALNDGLHKIRYMLLDTDGIVSSSVVRNFFRVSTNEEDAVNCICFVDGTKYSQEQIKPELGVVNWDIDMTSIERGLHNIEVQVISADGSPSYLYSSLFLRTLTDNELSSLDCYCIIDDNLTQIVEGIKDGNVYNFEIDVKELEEGEHTLTYLLLNKEGVVTDVRTAHFEKEPDANGITNLEMDDKETVIYDIAGRRVNEIVTSGIYIINGKKVMIKKR